MITHYTFKNIDSSDSLKTYAEEKAERFKKYFDGNVELTWTFDKQHGEFVSHCHLIGNRMDYFGEGQATDAYATVDLALTRLEKQIKKHKEIVTDHH